VGDALEGADHVGALEVLRTYKIKSASNNTA
jgi:hypothetical protein